MAVLSSKKILFFIFIYANCSLAMKSSDQENVPVPASWTATIAAAVGAVKNAACEFFVSAVTYPDTRWSMDRMFNKKTKNYFDIGEEKCVALTIDDGFNRDGLVGNDLIEPIKKTLSDFGAKATFFVTGRHLQEEESEKIAGLLDDGHELANHNWLDARYGYILGTNFTFKTFEEFKSGFEQTNEKIEKVSGKKPPNFYRAPCASITTEQLEWLEQKGCKHILGDVYPFDVVITDYEWIGEFIAKKARPGSIIVLHMPEKGFRQWNTAAIEKTLQKLQDKGYEVITLSKMETKERKYLGTE